MTDVNGLSPFEVTSVNKSQNYRKKQFVAGIAMLIDQVSGGEVVGYVLTLNRYTCINLLILFTKNCRDFLFAVENLLMQFLLSLFRLSKPCIVKIPNPNLCCLKVRYHYQNWMKHISLLFFRIHILKLSHDDLSRHRIHSSIF